ncbi:MAG: signal peptidase I [Patescibacteria group bacterium]
MKKLSKIIYYVVLAFIFAVAILLIVFIFPVTGIKVLTVLSGSMEPSIHTGSLVLVKPTANYKIGDIVTFGLNTKTQIPTTHRIAEIRVQEGQTIYKTKGDANNAEDMKEVAVRDIIGKVYISVPLAGYAVDFVRKPLGLILIIVLPALYIVYDEVKKIMKEVKKIKNSKISNNLEGNV